MRTTRIPILLAVLLSIGCGDGRATRDDGLEDAVPWRADRGRLVLEEYATWPSPSEGMTGAVILAEDEILVWNRMGEMWSGQTGRDLKALGRAELVVLGDRDDSGPSSVQLVDPEEGLLLWLEPMSGSVSRSEDCPALLRATSAARVGSLLFILAPTGQTGDLTIKTLPVREDGACEGIARTPEFRGGVAEIGADAVLSADDGLVVLNFLSPLKAPWVFRVEDGNAIGRREPGMIPRLPGSVNGGWNPKWASLPTIPLDGGFLRVFSDLRSDVRVFQVWSGLDSAPTQQILAEPIGLISGSRQHRLVAGMRLAPEPEVVVFRWSWEGG